MGSLAIRSRLVLRMRIYQCPDHTPLSPHRYYSGSREPMADEDLGLVQSQDDTSSGEEALVYICDEKHPTGAAKKAEARR